jgi:hypothetical protein
VQFWWEHTKSTKLAPGGRDCAKILPRDFFLAPHTSGPRDVPRCGAVSLLQRRRTTGGGPAETAARLNVKLRDLTGGDSWPPNPPPCTVAFGCTSLGKTTPTAALPCSFFRCAWYFSIAWATPRSRQTGVVFYGGGVRFAVFLAGCYNYCIFRSPVSTRQVRNKAHDSASGRFCCTLDIKATKRALAYGY